jgi:Ceramidase
MSRHERITILLGVAVAAGVAMGLLPRLPQDPAYHRFADLRPLWGVANGWNVLSNLAFLGVGLYGLFRVWMAPAGPHTAFVDARERWPYALFFAGVALTGVGSAYYHWAPDTPRLFWDRLPMTVGFTALLAAIVAERVSVSAGLVLLGPLVAAGVGSIVYWRAGELEGAGDLRPYALVQFLPALLILLMLWWFPPRYTGRGFLLGVLAVYGVAKVFEALDGPIFSVGFLLSGHTLKHLTVALAAWWVVKALDTRRAAATEEQT